MTQLIARPALVQLAAATLLATAAALPATAADNVPAAKPVKAAAKPATPRQQLRDEAKGLALATTTVEQITEAQLEMAARVLVGTAECEFDQKIAVQAVDGQPGHFRVGYKKAVYTMVPQETTTGAVRLEDKRAGVVWLQIPAKSMLMNSKMGQRMVDGCTVAEQRAVAVATPAVNAQ